MREWVTVPGIILIYLGTGFCLTAAIGLLRLPNAYARFHAATKALTAGVLFLATGSALYMATLDYAVRLALIVFLFLISNPVGMHAVARAVHRIGLKEDERHIFPGRSKSFPGTE